MGKTATTASGLLAGLAMLALPAAAQDDAALIESAAKAAPDAVSAGATIYAMAADGSLRTLRDGTNGWWCMPDDHNTPGEDPMCGDANAFAWAGAWLGRSEPPPGRIGFIYMLMGGPAGSNTDPYAMTPPGGMTWVETGPHVMIVNTRGHFAGYPGGASPDTAQPYVMWEGTPYEHLMIPIR
ncbi:MAG: hypothetical protein KJZ85_11420 [Rhodobacteraceae bacterium]|jgi:hypothetical protein|nr:hypothetical protein [Paracoccaceae bacterium]